MSRAKLVLMVGQSNCEGYESLANLQGTYTSATPYSTIKVWNGGGSGFLAMDNTGNTNQWPETSSKFGIEFKLMTSIQAYYGDTVYICKPAWGSHGLQDGAGSAGTYDPDIRGTSSKWDTIISAYNEAYNNLFQTYKNNIDILAMVYIGGEADAKAPYASTWEAALTSFISKLRAATGRPSLPFIITKLSSSVDPTTFPQASTLNTGTDNVAGAVSGVYTINTDACSLQGDNTHYDATGYETLGGLVYSAMTSNGLLV